MEEVDEGMLVGGDGVACEALPAAYGLFCDLFPID